MVIQELSDGEWYAQTENGVVGIARNDVTEDVNPIRITVYGPDHDLATFIVAALNAREDGSDVADDREG